jgi:hypothetical protein
MTLRDFVESGIELDGYRKVQCWQDETSPTIYYEGYGFDVSKEYMDRNITYIFPYERSFGDGLAICIELEVC